MTQAGNRQSPHIRVGRVLALVLIFLGLAHSARVAPGSQTASLNVISALGFALLLFAMQTHRARGRLRQLRTTALSLVLLVATQRMIEALLTGWPVLISPDPLHLWGFETRLDAEFSLQTAVAHAALAAAFLCKRRSPQLSTAATLFSGLIVTLTIQRLAFRAVLTDAELSIFSVGLMSLLTIDLMYHKRDERPFSGLMCGEGRCTLVRGLGIAAIAIPCAVGVWLAKTFWLSPHIAQGLEIAFGSMSVLLVGLILWAGDLMRTQHLEIEQAAVTDPLTKICNRRGILQAVKTWRYHALVMVDLDRLKWMNDSYGHELGDAAIQRAADALRQEIGADGKVGRWGGDEFIILLKADAAARLIDVYERLQTALNGIKLPLPGGGSITLSASMGPAMMESSLDGFDQARSQADKALYHSKACIYCKHRDAPCSEALKLSLFDVEAPRDLVDRCHGPY